jgi:hypothetical protein
MVKPKAASESGQGFLVNDENLPNITSFSLAYKHEVH